MTLPSAQELAQKPLPEVVDFLVEVAREARAAARLGDALGPVAAFERIRDAARLARGPTRDLLDVAGAFLEGMLKLDHGRRDLALRRFFQEHPEESHKVFSRILREESVTEATLRSLAPTAQPAIQPLLNAEVLSRVGDRFQLGPKMRYTVMDLIEPMKLRHWREVQETRTLIALATPPLRANEAAAVMASRIGISQDEAVAHLKRDILPKGRHVGFGVRSPRPAALAAEQKIQSPQFGGQEPPSAAMPDTVTNKIPGAGPVSDQNAA